MINILFRKYKNLNIVDRYGMATGHYLSPINTPIEMRALPPNTNLNNYHQNYGKN